MINNYINIYNNLVKLTRNKILYKDLSSQDTFSDRLIIFQFHFAFFLQIYKKNTKKKELQQIYDCIFKQLEHSIREIGYSDVTINKKMKVYVNIFYSILNRIDNWENLTNPEKDEVFFNYLNSLKKCTDLTIYFEKYRIFLINNTLNSLTKGVIKLNF